MPKSTTAELLSRPCPRCNAGPGARCHNHKNRPCKMHKERKRRHVPNVQSLDVIQERVTKRNEIRHAALKDWMKAVSACGAGASAYGRHTYRDRSGAKPDIVVYVCRRPQWSGWRTRDGKLPEEIEPTINDRLGPPFIAYYTNKPGGDESPGGFGFRWELSIGVIDIPEVESAERLQRAAQKRRDKELARQKAEAEKLAEWKRRNEPRSLFDTEPLPGT